MSKIAPMQAAALSGTAVVTTAVAPVPVKATATKAAVSKPAIKKPAAKSTAKAKSSAVRKPAAKAKPAPKAKPVVKAKPTSKVKPQKVKMERDSFTMPKDEYAQLILLKARLTSLGQPAKKSELLRAGVQLLVAMSDNTLKMTLAKIPVIKTGRPKKK